MLILSTKLHMPASRAELVPRPRLTERLNEGNNGKLILVSAPAGFGKTTLVSEWAAGCRQPVAWISMDEGDNDPIQFLAYFIAALQTIKANIAEGVLSVLQYAQSPPNDSMLTTLLNEISTIPENFTLVLDDYHVANSKAADHILKFLLEHSPPQMHLIITTREELSIPLNRLRVQNQLTELRAVDLRFTSSEAAEFLNRVMSLHLSTEDITALENRTEGWIAGLQLAAISMKGQHDTSSFIKSFRGSHRFVLDYLMEEVFEQQPKSIQTFLLHTSILDRMCDSLCDAVLQYPSVRGQEILEQLERANMFIVSLDNERRWYRYHHLFADMLRQRLYQSSTSSKEDEKVSIAELHKCASEWYECNGLEIEAFHHAVSANDVDRGARLIEGNGIPLYFRGAVVPVLNWLKSLPAEGLNTNPSLWTAYASLTLLSGQINSVEEKLLAAEAAMQNAVPYDNRKDLIGRICAIKATLALASLQVETVITQSKLALEYLSPDNLAFRTFTIWKLGFAYFYMGDRAAANQAFTEAIAISQASGNIITAMSAIAGLGAVQETDNQLYLANQTYRRVLQMIGDMPLYLISCEANLGLARIFYQWNDLDAAEQYGQQSFELAPKIENTDKIPACKLFFARLKLARGDALGATSIIAEAEHFLHRHNIKNLMPEVAAMRVLVMIRQGDLEAAARLAGKYQLPFSQARIYLAKGDVIAALRLLEPLLREMEAKGWEDERLKVKVLMAVAHSINNENEKALQVLSNALALAEPGGFIHIFIEEGAPMTRLLSQAAALGIMPDYVNKLLAAFESERKTNPVKVSTAQFSFEPLSQRELEVLQLVAQGLSNNEIAGRLAIALDTVKGHNRSCFGKLQVQRRTEAIARARELGLI